MSNPGRVIGVGGIFHTAKDPKALYQWYADNLGLKPSPYGFLFEKSDAPEDRGHLQFSMFTNTDYMEPSKNPYMINFRVDNLDALLAKLQAIGVHPTKPVESFDYGKFAHILDPEGNKLELWEPTDSVFSAMESEKNPINRP